MTGILRLASCLSWRHARVDVSMRLAHKVGVKEGEAGWRQGGVCIVNRLAAPLGWWRHQVGGKACFVAKMSWRQGLFYG